METPSELDRTVGWLISLGFDLNEAYETAMFAISDRLTDEALLAETG